MIKWKNKNILLLIMCMFLGTVGCAENVSAETQKNNVPAVEFDNHMVEDSDISVSKKASDDSKYLGTKSPYPYEENHISAAPEDYKPVFIQYVGRHGSRHQTKAKYDITLFELLSIAEKENQITETGKELKDQIGKLIEFEKDDYGQLTKLGRENLNKIGERTAANYKEVFADGKPILGYATYKQRTQDSRDEFFAGLKKNIAGNQITTASYSEDQDPYLRPFDFAPDYKEYEENGAWKKKVEKYAQKKDGKINSKRVLTQFFSEEFYNRLDKGEFQIKDLKGKVALSSPTDAVTNLYNLYTFTPSLASEGGNFNFKKYFTSKELKWYADLMNMEDFYSKGPSLEDTDVTVNFMAPLVKYMITSSDDALKNENYAGIFSFAHAETIIPLTAFLEIDGCSKSTDEPKKVADKWKGAEVSPMSANIQWIFYSNGEDYLVKMLHNEKEVAFPIKTDTYPYYKWEDVKKYYTKKVEKLGISLDSTMEENMNSLNKDF